jgi:hypothetical protein
LYYFPGDQLREVRAGMDAIVVYNKNYDVGIFISINANQKSVITNESLENFGLECYLAQPKYNTD